MIPDWITAVVALFAFLLSLFNTYTLRREMRLGLIEPRLEAYRSLWKHMDLAAPSRFLKDPTKDLAPPSRLKDSTEENKQVKSEDLKETLTKKDLETIYNNLRGWYYREGVGGNGIFLSNKASRIYREALKALLNARECDPKSTIDVLTCLSELRSRTKNDVAVFGRWEK